MHGSLVGFLGVKPLSGYFEERRGQGRKGTFIRKKCRSSPN